MLIQTSDGDQIMVEKDRDHRFLVKIYYNGGFPDGSGCITLNKEDLDKLKNLLEWSEQNDN